MKKQILDLPLVDLYLIFEKSSSTNWIFNLQKSILKLIFTGYTGSKNPVHQTGFFQIDFSDQQGVSISNEFHNFKTICSQHTVKPMQHCRRGMKKVETVG